MFLFDAIQFRALGTQVLFCSPAAAKLDRAVRALIEEHEERFSRFRPSSELEGLSARAGERVEVSEELFEVLTLAAQFWRATDGIFDPLVRDQLEAAGYDRSFEQVPAASQLPVAAPGGFRPTFAEVELDPAARTVRLPAGCRLDLGGIAKGWIVDRVALLLELHGPFLIDIGGDIAARGEGPDGGQGWLVGVSDPYREERDRCWLRLDRQAVATSTTLRRRWRRAGCWQHHLIDPRSGSCAASDIDQVTVIAPSAIEADIFAKTALILGRDEGLDWLARRALPALLLGPGGATPTPEWKRFELPVQAA